VSSFGSMRRLRVLHSPSSCLSISVIQPPGHRRIRRNVRGAYAESPIRYVAPL
jgi:hypothetical protein